MLVDDAAEHCGDGLDFVEGEVEFDGFFVDAVVSLDDEEWLAGVAVHEFFLTLDAEVASADVRVALCEEGNGEVGFVDASEGDILQRGVLHRYIGGGCGFNEFF